MQDREGWWLSDCRVLVVCSIPLLISFCGGQISLILQVLVSTLKLDIPTVVVLVATYLMLIVSAVCVQIFGIVTYWLLK